MTATLFVLSEHEHTKRYERKPPRPRVFRDHTYPSQGFIDTELISLYRFPRYGILELLDYVKRDVPPQDEVMQC